MCQKRDPVVYNMTYIFYSFRLNRIISATYIGTTAVTLLILEQGPDYM
jgi:hypothetical protein